MPYISECVEMEIFFQQHLIGEVEWIAFTIYK